MNYTGAQFYKDPLDELDTDLSDISDVKQSDLDKILKSAKDLDDEILIGAKDKSKASEKDVKKSIGKDISSIGDDPFGILSSDEDLALHHKVTDVSEKKLSKDTLNSLFGATDDDLKLEEPKILLSTKNLDKEQKPKLRNSSDWLGLTASPEKFKQDVKQTSSAPSFPLSSTPTHNKEHTSALSLNRSRTESDLFSRKVPSSSEVGKLADSKIEETKAPSVKRKTNLLDDLFGSSRIRKDEPKSDKKVEFSGLGANSTISDPKTETESSTTGYMPSLSAGRKLERKRESSSNLLSASKLELDNQSDMNFNFEEKPTNKVTVPYRKSETTSSAGYNKQRPKSQFDENALPPWLSDGKTSGQISPRRESEPLSDFQKPPKTASLESTVPEWLGASETQSRRDLEKIAGPNVLSSAPFQAADPVETLGVGVTVQPKDVGEVSSEINVVGQLASVQAHLGAAMAKHNRNLQSYMQVLMNEAQRVAIGSQMVFLQEDRSITEQKDEQKEEMKETILEKEQNIKQQSDVIFDLQTNITKLELQNVQLELKIKNTEELKDMEVEKLKQQYGFEISNWGKKLERTKTFYEEIISEYEGKVARLKETAGEVEKEFQKRLETLEAQRLTDLDKLGEFHRLALEHSASISINHPNFSSFRIPLKAPAKPSDEIELTEREAALIDKERNIEILKAAIEAEKRDLDEALEVEKVRREEREREVSRAMMEVKLKEEFNSKDYNRKIEQLKEQEQQLKALREEALKEQSELSKEKLLLAAEKARLDATISIQSDPNSPNLNPMDLMRARAELDAALEAARTAREIADQERRRHVELRKTIEEISWEQKEKDHQLENRERHIGIMIRESENKREEGLKALEQAHNLAEELEEKRKEINTALKHIESKEKVLAKERLEIAKERLELSKRKSQLELLLPELNPADNFTFNTAPRQPINKEYVDPKAVIMRLKAEKDLQDYIAPIRKKET